MGESASLGHPLPSLTLCSSTASSDIALKPPTDGISSLAFSQDSSRLLVASWDGVSRMTNRYMTYYTGTDTSLAAIRVSTCMTYPQ